MAEGAYGDIWKCVEVASNTLFALKEIKLQNRELQEMYEKEVSILVPVYCIGVSNQRERNQGSHHASNFSKNQEGTL